MPGVKFLRVLSNFIHLRQPRLCWRENKSILYQTADLGAINLVSLISWELCVLVALPGSPFAMCSCRPESHAFRATTYTTSSTWLIATHLYHTLRSIAVLVYLLLSIHNTEINGGIQKMGTEYNNNNLKKLKIKSVAYSSQGSHTGQLDFCNWLADDSTTG